MVKEDLLEVGIVNAWVIFHHNCPESDVKSHREFQLKLAEELVQPVLDLRASTDCPKYLLSTKGRHPVGDEKRLLGKHFAYRSTKRGRCSVCSMKVSPVTNKKKDTKTQNFCQKCGMFLCVGVCFEVYHTHTSY